jgi:hypothetical protein
MICFTLYLIEQKKATGNRRVLLAVTARGVVKNSVLPHGVLYS